MIICLDYGTRYIGVAITDDEERLAVRHSVVDQKQAPALDIIPALVAREAATKVLVGVPVSLSGNISEQTNITREFIEQLRPALAAMSPPVPVEEVDETLTSYEAERRIKLEGGSKDEAHAEAARIMLETYIHTQI